MTMLTTRNRGALSRSNLLARSEAEASRAGFDRELSVRNPTRDLQPRIATTNCRVQRSQKHVGGVPHVVGGVTIFRVLANRLTSRAPVGAAPGPPRSHDARGADPRDGVRAGLRRGLVRDERQALGTASGQHGRRDPGGTAAAAVVVDDRVAVGGARPDFRVAVARHSPPEDHAAVALGSALPDDDDLAAPRGRCHESVTPALSTRASTPRTFDDQPRTTSCRTLGVRSAA